MLKSIFSFTSNAVNGTLGSHYSWRDFHEPRLRQILLNYEYNNSQVDVFYVFLRFGTFSYAEVKSYDNSFEPYSGYGFSSIPLKTLLVKDQRISLDSVLSFYHCPETKHLVIFVLPGEGAVHFKPPSTKLICEAYDFAKAKVEEKCLSTSYMLDKFVTALDRFSPSFKCKQVCDLLTSNTTNWEKMFSHYEKRPPPATEENIEILKQYFLIELSNIRWSSTSLCLEH